MKVWPGLQLIGAGSRCLKGMFYTVVACDDAKVELNTGVGLTHQQAFESLRLSYALTYASCQGLTMPGVVRLDTQSSHFTMKHLYVGLSRATAADLVEVTGRSAPASLGLHWSRRSRLRRSRRGFLRLRIFRIFGNCCFGLCHLLYCQRFFQSIVRVKEIFATEFTILKSRSLNCHDNCWVVMAGMSKKTLVDME